ncbi:MAG: serine O-acetyltransferase [Candidatus Thiodiazotropha sp.]
MEELYYLMRKLYLKKIPILPRLLMIIIRVVFGSFVPPETSIGKNINFGHKMGIVISRHARIGDNVIIRHQVTIGSGRAIIGNDVDIGSGAKIIGNLSIGDRSIIGANAVVTKEIPCDVVVAGVPANIIKTLRDNE